MQDESSQHLWSVVGPHWSGRIGTLPCPHLAEAGIRELEGRGSLGTQTVISRGAEDVAAEGDPGVHGSMDFLPLTKHIVTATDTWGWGWGGELGWPISALQAILGAEQGGT